MDQNLTKEILKVEDEANDIIYDAKKRARLIEAEVEKEIERIDNDLEKEYNEKVGKLRAEIQVAQKDEEQKLKEEFEEKQNRLKQIDQKDLEKMIMLVFKKICEA
jgi:vacuolar-type H+-ATPase subunit H